MLLPKINYEYNLWSFGKNKDSSHGSSMMSISVESFSDPFTDNVTSEDKINTFWSSNKKHVSIFPV